MFNLFNLHLQHTQVQLTHHDDIHFVAIGDWGSGHHHQKEVASAIGDFCFWNRCDFVVSTGDNMYTTGVDSPFDEKFDEKWKDVYTRVFLKRHFLERKKIRP